jgi:uncharacterized membrane protein
MMGYDTCPGHGGLFDGGWMAGAWLGLILFAILATLVVAGVVLAMRSGRRPAEDPREILRLRFARGEISAEELEQASRALGG